MTDADFLRKVDELAKLQTSLATKKAKRDEAVQAVMERHAAIDEEQKKADALHAELEKYITQPGVAERLLPKGKKTGQTSMATFSLKLGKPSLKIAEGKDAQEIISSMEQQGKHDWLSAGAVTLNKAAILGADMSEEELAEWGLSKEVKTSLTVKPRSSK